MEASVLMHCRLFQGLPEEKLPPLLEQLHSYRRSYEKGHPVYRVGDTAHALGAVFAETYACVPGTPMMVSAVAAEPSEVLFLPMDHLLAPAGREDSGRDVLLRNLLDVTARKNLTLTRKIFHTTPKSLRGRLLSYLSAQAVQNGCDTFDIPFDRQQLADYLGADRSALSNELSKMQRDGLLSFRKNHFVLHRK